MDSSDESSDSGGSDNEGTSGYRKGAYACIDAVCCVRGAHYACLCACIRCVRHHVTDIYSVCMLFHVILNELPLLISWRMFGRNRPCKPTLLGRDSRAGTVCICDPLTARPCSHVPYLRIQDHLQSSHIQTSQLQLCEILNPQP